MFAVIQNTQPDWIIAENVRGLVTWNEGMVLEQVCADLESEGYEVQPLIIPACAIGAPHRRDRVWIIAHTNRERERAGLGEVQSENGEISEWNNNAELSDTDKLANSNTRQQLWKSWSSEGLATDTTERTTSTIPDKRGCFADWKRDWREVATSTCNDGMDDGLPRQMDGVTISSSKHRKERLKACGNAIVPQVAMEIFRAIIADAKEAK
jgi:DNA (cytosine-5)-methyltransferase 1